MSLAAECLRWESPARRGRDFAGGISGEMRPGMLPEDGEDAADAGTPGEG